MHTIQAVLFDFGKVLSLPPNPVAWARLRELTGLSEADLQARYWATRDDYDSGLYTGNEYWTGIAGNGVSAETLSALKATDVDLWTEMNQPMLDWVAALHSAGVRTGILSNMPDAMAEGICARFDWIGNFDHTVWSHALKLRKPQLEIYAAAADGLGVAPQHILFLDDKTENIEAAQAFGMKAILYSTHDDFEEQMKAQGFADLLQPANVA